MSETQYLDRAKSVVDQTENWLDDNNYSPADLRARVWIEGSYDGETIELDVSGKISRDNELGEESGQEQGFGIDLSASEETDVNDSENIAEIYYEVFDDTLDELV